MFNDLPDEINKKIIDNCKEIINPIHFYNLKNINKDFNNSIMDLKDLYSNLCPLDYNINMIKMKDMVTRVNQYPGYTSDILIDITRQIKSDEALPTTADFFK